MLDIMAANDTSEKNTNVNSDSKSEAPLNGPSSGDTLQMEITEETQQQAEPWPLLKPRLTRHRHHSQKWCQLRMSPCRHQHHHHQRQR